MMTLSQWGNDWCDDGNGSPIEYLHRGCGQKTEVTMSCSECGERLQPHDVTPMIGPGLAAALERGDGMFSELPDKAAISDKLPPYLRKSITG